MPTTRPLRMEDYNVPEAQVIPRGYWWYVRDVETGAVIAIGDAHLEPDVDDEGRTYYDPAYDKLRILDNGEWRELTGEESDEYSDDIYAWLRECDWSN